MFYLKILLTQILRSGFFKQGSDINPESATIFHSNGVQIEQLFIFRNRHIFLQLNLY